MSVRTLRRHFERASARFFQSSQCGKRVLIASLLGTTALSLTTQAQAQTAAVADSSASPLSEIVVTAQKRASTVQATPMSIVAVSGVDLRERGITSVMSLAQATPGVSLKSEGPGQTEIEMRGMTSSGGNSATVGYYLDDMPLTAPAGAQNGKVVIDPSLYDLNRIEVLRGPQGTLYGAGSMGGTVKLVTNQPDLAAYHASAESTLSGTDGGSFNHADNFMLNLPLVQDKLALRIVGTEAYTSGWITRIVADPFPLPSPNGEFRGDVQAAPIEGEYPNSNADQLYGTRVTLLWKPTEQLTITPTFLYQFQHANGISAYDSTPGTETHYEPFNVPEPLYDRIIVYGLTANYSFKTFDVTSVTAQWNRVATQLQDGSEAFNNPNTGMTYAANYGLPNPGYYGPTGSGIVYSYERDPSEQFSEELRAASTGQSRLNWVGGVYFSSFKSVWNLYGYSANPSAYMDEGTGLPATTTTMWNAVTPTELRQYAVFGDATYSLTDQLKAEVGLRWYAYDTKFSSVIAGWGSALGAATPSATGLITQSAEGFEPKFDISYDFTPRLKLYVDVAKGFRPGGGDIKLPTTGAYWSQVFSAYGFSGTQWPSTYQSDSVWSYEIGEKARLFNGRLIVNAAAYFEDWSNIQLQAEPGDWMYDINGKEAKIYGGEIETRAVLGGGFQATASAGYTHILLDAGPHWQIVPSGVLTDVPPVTANFGLSYDRALTDKYDFTARVENSYVGPRYSLDFPYGYSANGRYNQLPSYDLTNIRAGIESHDGWSAALFVNNLFNKKAQLEYMFAESLPSANYNRIMTNQPLTAGIDLAYKY
jgi:outer membrane receptor protein involved in Fe transport